ncbi:hypothetical protein EB796_015458 [Bugula neritina]|uniref:Uncharacterized protein n=1 Tax=Bugula neritina TaxID=10212 RepID=A0A7J7JKX7_BUGNE|nr:hypothetical protein EB796_015458 [Bugula neritina]
MADVTAAVTAKDSVVVGVVNPLTGYTLLGIVIAATVCGLVLLMLIVLTILLLLRRCGCMRRGKLDSFNTAGSLKTANNNTLARQGPSISEIELEKLAKTPQRPENNQNGAGDHNERAEDNVPLMIGTLPSPPDATDKNLTESYHRNSWVGRDTSFRLNNEERDKVLQKIRKPKDPPVAVTQPQLVSPCQSDFSPHEPPKAMAFEPSTSSGEQSKPLNSPSSPKTLTPSTPPAVIYQPTLISRVSESPLPSPGVSKESKQAENVSAETTSNVKQNSIKNPVPKPARSPQLAAVSLPVNYGHHTSLPATIPEQSVTPDSIEDDKTSNFSVATLDRTEKIYFRPEISKPVGQVSCKKFSCFNTCPESISATLGADNSKVAPWDRHATPSPRGPKPLFTEDPSIRRSAQKAMSVQEYNRLNSLRRAPPSERSNSLRANLTVDKPNPFHNLMMEQSGKVATVKPTTSPMHSVLEKPLNQNISQGPLQGHIKVASPEEDDNEINKSS